MDSSLVFARWRQCAPNLIHASLDHPRPQPKQHLNRFIHFAQLTAECRRACPGMSFPIKIAPSFEAIWTTSLIHGSFGPLASNSKSQMASGSIQPFFAQLTIVADRPTDHATWSVTIYNRPHLCIRIVLRCGLKVRLYDTAGCQSGLTTGLTTGCIV